MYALLHIFLKSEKTVLVSNVSVSSNNLENYRSTSCLIMLTSLKEAVGCFSLYGFNLSANALQALSTAYPLMSLLTLAAVAEAFATVVVDVSIK